MAYIPPAVHARPNHAPFARPSGDLFGDATAGSRTLAIDGMPPRGRVTIDGVMRPDAGTWEGSRWLVPLEPNMMASSVIVTDTTGASREFTYPTPTYLLGEVIDYATMTPVEDADVGTLRVFGAPHTQLLVNGVLQSGSAAGGVVTYGNLPTGTYGVVINAADGFRWTPVVNIVRGQTTQLPLVRPAAPVAESGPRPTVDFTMGGGFNIGGAGGGSAASGFTITGIPSTATGLAVRIDGQTANGTLSGGVWTANGTLVAGRSVMVQVRLQQGAGLSSFLLAPVERRVDVPASGTVSVPFSSFVAPDATTPTPTPTPTARLVVNGPVGWRVGVGANGSNGTSIAYGALPASGSMALDLAPGTYALRVDTDRATGRLDAITLPVGGRTIDARTWVPAFPAPAPTPPAPVDRGTQGPTAAVPTKGTIVLRGAPGQAVVTIPAAGLSHTVDATGRPVALDVLPGTYGLTVTPVGDVQRVKSVAVAAGQTVEVVYGTMATPSALEIEQVQPVELMCGPVLNRAALPWAPATACPGNELTAPDGTRWRALAATGGVTLAQLRSDGTPAPAGMGLGTKVLIVGVVAAAGYAGWMWYSNRKPSGGKQENPGKCSCGG